MSEEMKYERLLTLLTTVHQHVKRQAVSALYRNLVLRNWHVGAYIVEFEQKGADRAQYGTRLFENLAADLKKKNVPGLGVRMLKNCRRFYNLYPQISQTVSGEFAALSEIRQSVIAESNGDASTPTVVPESEIRQPVIAESDNSLRPDTSEKKPTPFSPDILLQLSWTHFLALIEIDDAWKRAFYENQCLSGGWSVRQLNRQIDTMLYERTGLSTDKYAVINRAREQAAIEPVTIEEYIRDPYILEFAGLSEKNVWLESELETALLNHLQAFLLELGTGFCFEARQMRVDTGAVPDRVDLVFYHRILRCHVLIDLKIRTFRPADAGQMNYYLNYFKSNIMNEGDMPPVGIILCCDRDSAKVEFATAGLDNKLFVSRYLVALPSAEQLQQFIESDRDRVERAMKETEAAPNKSSKDMLAGKDQ